MASQALEAGSGFPVSWIDAQGCTESFSRSLCRSERDVGAGEMEVRGRQIGFVV